MHTVSRTERLLQSWKLQSHGGDSQPIKAKTNYVHETIPGSAGHLRGTNGAGGEGEGLHRDWSGDASLRRRDVS